MEESVRVLDDNQSSPTSGVTPTQNGRNNNDKKDTTTSPTTTTTTTTFKVVHENTGNIYAVWCRFCIPTVLAICVAVMLSSVQDVQLLQQQWLWIVVGAVLALLVFESTQHFNSSSTELVVKLCPLGVQRSLTRNKKHHYHHPLLFTESIQDCILLEHVEVFAVTTHVMFRIRRKQKIYDNNNQETIQLVPAFPHACLSFHQCNTLQKQIQASLEEIK
jgi:hypothetical protein